MFLCNNILLIIPFKNVLVNLRFLEERPKVLFCCILFHFKYFPYHQETQDLNKIVNTVTRFVKYSLLYLSELGRKFCSQHSA